MIALSPGRKIKGLQLWLATLLFCSAVAGEARYTAAADTSYLYRNSAEQRLVGRWLRPDGGYLLELSPTEKPGRLSGSYFNPRPIKVSRTETACKSGSCTVTVELRDVNYPGSTYTLRYDSAADRLVGTYFQAVEKQTYEVEFVRSR